MTSPISAIVPDPQSREFEPVEIIPSGDYRARLSKVEEKPNNFNPESPQWLWTWRIEDPKHPEYPDHPIWQYTSQKLGEFEDKDTGQIKKSEARKNIEALLDGPLEPGQQIDFASMLIGMQVFLSVGIKPNGQGEPRNKVIGVFPLSVFVKSTRQLAGTQTANQAIEAATAGAIAQQQQQPQGARPSAAITVEVPGAAALNSQLRTRYEGAQKLLGWDLQQLKETIGWIAASDEPFFKLTLEQKQKVVEYLEQEINSKDVPFFAEDETKAASAEEAPAPAKQPASTKHRIA